MGAVVDLHDRNPWNDLPTERIEIALLMFQPHKPRKRDVHWLRLELHYRSVMEPP